MKNNATHRLRSLEAARAVAALLVVLMHAANLMRVEHLSGAVGLNNFFGFGYVGVDFFFVLSGFIITYVHFHEEGKFDRVGLYMWRRFSRVYPIFWFFLFASIALTVAGRIVLGKAASLDWEWSDFLHTLLLIPSVSEPKYVGVAWSLQFEILFYIVFCVFFLLPRVWKILFLVWFIFLIGKISGLWSIALPLKMDSAYCLQFLFGVMVGVLARKFELRCRQKGVLLAAAVAVVAVAFETLGPLGPHSEWGRVVVGVASALLIGALVAAESAAVIQAPKWLVKLGGASYSIYLGHIIFLNIVYMVLLKTNLYHMLPEVVTYAIAVTTAVGVTFIIGRKIELPLVGYLKSYQGDASRPTNPA